MTHAERSDARLIELSRHGLASAFGVLVYRHGHQVLQLTEDDEDPIGATVAVFIRAMRTLADADLDDVGDWLVGLTAAELGRDPAELTVVAAPTSAPTTAARPAGAATLLETLDPRLDEVWAELAPRWPTGRRPRHLPSWVIWLGTTIVLLALAVLLPWAVLGSLGNGQPTIPELRASPVLEDIEVEDEPIVEEDAEPLPTFDFPEPPGEDGSGDTSPTETTPEPEPDPSPPSPDPPLEQDAGGDADGDDPGDATDTGGASPGGETDPGGGDPPSDGPDPTAPNPGDTDPDPTDPDAPDTDPVGADPSADDAVEAEPSTATDT